MPLRDIPRSTIGPDQETAPAVSLSSRVTTARNLTPQGKEIEGRGILPDVELKDLGKKRRDKKDEWIEAAEKILAKDAAGTGEKE